MNVARLLSPRTVLGIILMPWILAIPPLLYLQWAKQHLGATYQMSPTERKGYFLTQALSTGASENGIGTDFFALLEGTRPYVSETIRYRIRFPANLASHTKQKLIDYAWYDLLPARRSKRGEPADYVLYYRTAPPDGASVMLRLASEPQSYVVRTEEDSP